MSGGSILPAELASSIDSRQTVCVPTKSASPLCGAGVAPPAIQSSDYCIMGGATDETSRLTPAASIDAPTSTSTNPYIVMKTIVEQDDYAPMFDSIPLSPKERQSFGLKSGSSASSLLRAPSLPASDSKIVPNLSSKRSLQVDGDALSRARNYSSRDLSPAEAKNVAASVLNRGTTISYSSSSASYLTLTDAFIRPPFIARCRNSAPAMNSTDDNAGDSRQLEYITVDLDRLRSGGGSTSASNGSSSNSVNGKSIARGLSDSADYATIDPSRSKPDLKGTSSK